MAAAAFFGHALLGLGPGVAFFFVIIAPKSFLVLLSLFSAFAWLLVMLVTSALLRGFAPLPPTAAAHAGALLAAVALEEAARYGVWRLHRASVGVLHRMSLDSGHTFTVVDELYLAVGWGYGHAALHSLMLFGSLLPLTAGHGTLYTATCPQMSVFLVAALNSLGMGATLIALSVVALDAWARGALWGKAYAPLAHTGAALLTLGSMRPGGCVPAVAAQLVLGLANAWYAAALAWRRASSSSNGSSGSGSRSRSRSRTARVSSSGAAGRDVDLGAVPGQPAAAWPEDRASAAFGGGGGAGAATAAPAGAAAAAAAATAAAGLRLPHAARTAGLAGGNVHDSPPPMHRTAAAVATRVSPRSTGSSSLRSRGVGQQSSGVP